MLTFVYREILQIFFCWMRKFIPIPLH